MVPYPGCKTTITSQFEHRNVLLWYMTHMSMRMQCLPINAKQVHALRTLLMLCRLILPSHNHNYLKSCHYHHPRMYTLHSKIHGYLMKPTQSQKRNWRRGIPTMMLNTNSYKTSLKQEKKGPGSLL